MTKNEKTKDEVKFPFTPNERCKAAFRQEAQLRRAVSIMTEALAKVATDIISPWEIVKQEHPNLIRQPNKKLRYIEISETIEIVE